MEITGIQGSGSAGHIPKPKATMNPGATGGPKATPAAGQSSATVSASNSTSQSVLFDSNARPLTGNLALAFMILSMLLEGSKDSGNDENNLFAMGLAAGLLAAEQSTPRTFFYSSSHSQTSVQAVVGSRDVEASYQQNMELPAVAADPAGTAPDAQGTTQPVHKINEQV